MSKIKLFLIFALSLSVLIGLGLLYQYYYVRRHVRESSNSIEYGLPKNPSSDINDADNPFNKK